MSIYFRLSHPLQRIFLIAVFVSLSGTIYAQQWSATNAALFANRIDDIYFLSPDSGWAATSEGQILRTDDGGGSWLPVYSNSDLYFRCIEFINEDIGFAGTLDSVLLRTDDGGASWTEIQNQIPTPIPGLCGLSHYGDHVFGVGLFAYPAYFIRSTDQGLTWTYSDLSALADGLVECHFIDENVGYIAGIDQGSGGVILKTTDGGISWTLVHDTQSGGDYVWKLDFVTSQIGYGSVESFTNSSRIVKTTDGGNTWNVMQVDPAVLDLQGIGFINADTGWVGPRNQLMYETNDGGSTWFQTSLFSNVNRFFRINPDLMYASGSMVYRYSDTNVSIEEVELQVNTHEIMGVFPNPVAQQANVSIYIDERTNARLDVFDIQGNHISELYSGRIDPGEHRFPINPAVLNYTPSGPYLIVLRTNEGFFSQPLIKTTN